MLSRVRLAADWFRILPFRVATRLAVAFTETALIGLAIAMTLLAFQEQQHLVLSQPKPALLTTLNSAARAFLLAAPPFALFCFLTAFFLTEWLVGAPLRLVAERTPRIGVGGREGSIQEERAKEEQDTRVAA